MSSMALECVRIQIAKTNATLQELTAVMRRIAKAMEAQHDRKVHDIRHGD